MGNVSYAAFITWLLAFTTRLPAVLKKLESLVDSFVDFAETALGSTPTVALPIKGAPANQQLIVVTDEETALEGQLAAAVAGDSAAFDGSKLRAIWKFANDSGLLTVLMSVLAKSV